MLLCSNTDQNRLLLFQFLREHDVKLHASEDFQAIGVVGSDGKLRGVVGYNGFCGNVCSMHIAGEGNWITRELIWAAFDYPFNQLGIECLMSPVAGDNERALKLDKHFGNKEVLRVENGWDKGVDLVVLQLKKGDCRWLRKPKGV